MKVAGLDQLRYRARRYLRLMGSYLADTDLLLRLADPISEQHVIATQGLAAIATGTSKVQEAGTSSFAGIPFLKF